MHHRRKLFSGLVMILALAGGSACAAQGRLGAVESGSKPHSHVCDIAICEFPPQGR